MGDGLDVRGAVALLHEEAPLYQDFERHLPDFERMWSDTDSGVCLPRYVTEELQQFLTCGILSQGFAQMHCDGCRKRHQVVFSCKGRGFCPSCMGRRMNEGAANLEDHVFPTGVPIRQWVLTLPQPKERADASPSSSMPVFHPLPKPTQADIELVSTGLENGEKGGK